MAKKLEDDLRKAFEKATEGSGSREQLVATVRVLVGELKRQGWPPEKVIINIERFGNTTAATIPLALNDALCAGRLKKGQLVLLASVGAGFTVGAVLLRWGF